jgi:hypothetical protein
MLNWSAEREKEESSFFLKLNKSVTHYELQVKRILIIKAECLDA